MLNNGQQDFDVSLMFLGKENVLLFEGFSLNLDMKEQWMGNVKLKGNI